MGKRLLILTAGMGAGHDEVAAELARRLAPDGFDAAVVDVLDLLPLRLGRGLRRFYHGMILRTPWLYGALYRRFFVPSGPPRVSPLVVWMAARLDRALRGRPPDAVVSTFHLAAQVAGRLRESGRLPAASIVLVTDFAVHRLWLHRGNDRYLCPDEAAARTVTAATGRPATGCAPLVRPQFRRDARPVAEFRSADRPVLVSAGSWGVGEVAETMRVLARSGRYLPVVLCGRNERLIRRLRGAGAGLVLGWRDDIADLMAGAYAFVDNAAGLSCREAFARGLPVVSYRPIPGHGRDGARAMADSGVSVYARTPAELLDALDGLADPSTRDRQVARAYALFDAPAAEQVVTASA
ncbi:MGDG synthase family glycosyltransferase [Actinomadura rayongensis]|uniref:Diacylglycerol glucosyltransferase N-terminal domain-containing protein n=1 Tax=Actinomadura rayongensis TaxID=1429076 RepID=A0A6I4W9C5_9ACTN|nr:hypothetical protein [Actinomadura rayongensis]MXQ64875.1 hypothetical protein [Actinomadura rayongensis]